MSILLYVIVLNFFQNTYIFKKDNPELKYEASKFLIKIKRVPDKLWINEDCLKANF